MTTPASAPAAAAPIAVISPHLDDAVFSCGALLASRPGSYVVTVFAGGPESMERLTEWDRECGFSDGQDVISLRRQEETAALAALSASPVFLDLWDHQYRYEFQSEPDESLINRGADELEAALLELPTRTWLMPLGIDHPDHKLCRRIALRLFDRQPRVNWLIYEELAYYRLHWHQRWSARVAVSVALGVHGSWARPHLFPHTASAVATKMEAMKHYASQLGRLSEDFRRLASEGPESYLQLKSSPPPVQRVFHRLHKSV